MQSLSPVIANKTDFNYGFLQYKEIKEQSYLWNQP